MTARADKAVIVYVSNYLTDDARLRWTKRLGDDAWLDFVNTLVDHELAKWEPIEAGGPPKLRLAYEVPPAQIARQDATDGRVSAFWRTLRG